MALGFTAPPPVRQRGTRCAAQALSKEGTPPLIIPPADKSDKPSVAHETAVVGTFAMHSPKKAQRVVWCVRVCVFVLFVCGAGARGEESEGWGASEKGGWAETVAVVVSKDRGLRWVLFVVWLLLLLFVVESSSLLRDRQERGKGGERERQKVKKRSEGEGESSTSRG